MKKAHAATAAVVFALGLAVGWIISHQKHPPQNGESAITFKPGLSIRVIHPGDDGPRSVPLRVLRVEREANTAVVDPPQVWTFAIGDSLEAIWVYASPATP